MRRLALFLMVSSLFFASCEKDEGDKGCVKNIAFATSSSFVGVTGGLIEATKYKYLVIGETPNVSEATGNTYCDSTKSTEGFSFKAINLYANTKYYVKIFYRDASGKTIYSPEYTVTTDNSTTATTFNPVVKGDTLVGGKACFLLKYSFNTISDLRNAEFGVCYCKATDPGTAPVPTVSDKVIKGTLGKDGIVSCDISEVNFNEMENVRPYFKDSKGTVYGSIVTYSKSTWLDCGIFPGLPCFEPTTITVNGKGYVFVGWCPDQILNGSHVVDEMWSFDSQTLAWSKETSLKNILDYAYRISMKTAETSNGFLFFKGGDYSGRSYNQFFSYDIANKQYTQVLPNGIPENVWKYSWGSDGFLFNGKSYVVLYMGDSGYETAPKGTFIYSYDEANKVFTLESNNPDRAGDTDVAFFRRGENIYVGSGYYTEFGAVYAQDFWAYNLTTKVWTKLKDAPVKNFSYSFTYKNRCFAVGSDKNLYEYKPDSDTWVVLDNIKGGIQGFMTFDSSIYMLTTSIQGKHDGINSNFDRYVTRIKKCVLL